MGLTGSKAPLASTEESSIQLYDGDSVLEIKPEVAQGFLILLSGGGSGQSRPKRSKSSEREVEIDESALTVSFFALTDGNVIDACFGVLHAHPNDRDSDAYKASRAVKNRIAEASDTSDAIRRIAVEAYARAFTVSMEYHDARHQFPICLRCFKQGSIHRNAEESLKKAFEPLTEALEAST